ncbi:MAG: hypothetical protein M3245_00645, partial [Actinomycetota bacterium]|nr:hypothetical protein [Actinomycetota bacterium]
MKALIATATRILVTTVTSLTLLATLFQTAPAAAATRPTGLLVPSTGTLFGGYVDPDARWNGNDAAKAEVLQRETMLGRKMAVVQHYYSWTNTFPSGLEQWDIAGGRIPLVTWEPFGITLDSIISGAQDSVIRARARGLRDLGSPVFMRWAHEMNGDWYPWSGAQNGGGTAGPAKYVAAYRRVHTLFRAEGASNVAFVWSPNHESVPSQSWNHWSSYYPGDAYVDWVGPDGYNWGTTRSWSSWRSFEVLFRKVYDDYAARKPIMIADVGSAEQGGSKSSW